MSLVQKAKGVIRRIRRKPQYSTSWYWLDPSEIGSELNIIRLVSPLRYDIAVRKDFLALYLSHRELYHSKFDSFFELALEHPYYVCFQKMKPKLAHDHDALRPLYVNKVRGFISVYEQIATAGFNPQIPIVAKTGEQILPTNEGKRVSGRFFMGDGCHRLASLMILGYEAVPIDYIRIQCFPTLSPRDGTVELVHSIPVKPKKYFAFLSSRYTLPHIFKNGRRFLGHVKQHKPHLWNEVLSVIRADGMIHKCHPLPDEENTPAFLTQLPLQH